MQLIGRKAPKQTAAAITEHEEEMMLNQCTYEFYKLGYDGGAWRRCLLSQNLALLRDLTTVNTAPRLSWLWSLGTEEAASVIAPSDLSLYSSLFHEKESDLAFPMHDLFLFFSVHSGFVPIFVLSKAALTPSETITTNLAGEFSSTVLDHHRSSSDAASKFRLPNAACLPLSLVQFSLPLQLEYRTPRDRPTAQTQRTHTRTLSRPDRN